MSTKPDEELKGCYGGPCTTALGDSICKTCGRTAEQVLLWNTYTDDQKREINRGKKCK